MAEPTREPTPLPDRRAHPTIRLKALLNSTVRRTIALASAPVLAALLVGVATAPADAARHGPDCTDTAYEHDGRVVSVVECLGSLDIRQVAPAPAEPDPSPGTPVARARIIYDGTAQLVRGIAYAKAPGCEPVGFPVTGWLVMPAGPTGFRDIVLDGPAPELDDRCIVTGTRDATLIFRPIDPDATADDPTTDDPTVTHGGTDARP